MFATGLSTPFVTSSPVSFTLTEVLSVITKVHPEDAVWNVADISNLSPLVKETSSNDSHKSVTPEFDGPKNLNSDLLSKLDNLDITTSTIFSIT